ncbi:MAG TPA: type II toxin-antitoxin system RelE/ParE family toxin [Candidatus Nanoarchaeia archaeon]|nr:type II toxin-antitoxin system RelE/ParE family toxin [Candidatus Nanoarchaeia archaeon]
MTYTIIWYDAAQDDLRSLDRQVAARIANKVRSIELNPYRFVEHLESYPFFKLRIGDYRVIIDINAAEGNVKVILVGHRSKVYKEISQRI